MILFLITSAIMLIMLDGKARGIGLILLGFLIWLKPSVFVVLLVLIGMLILYIP